MTAAADWNTIQPKLEKDITENGVKRGEFVVSAMTKAIENSLQYFIQHSNVRNLPALDIGTGTAYHSALLTASGQEKIISVDINAQAIEYAKERLTRFFPKITQFNESDFELYLENSDSLQQSINLYNYALDEVKENKETKYSVVSFNPPILYPLLNTEFDKPATHGVYFENKEVENPQNDLVYKLYDSLAQNNLAKGSQIACVWANLNRHLVEIDPFKDDQKEFVHPTKILKNWFGFEFINEPESFEDFYCHKTILGAGFFNQSETGKLYSNNLKNGIDKGYYSDLLIPSEEDNLSGTYFHFGVLHLQKVSDDENKFKIINGSSKGKIAQL